VRQLLASLWAGFCPCVTFPSCGDEWLGCGKPFTPAGRESYTGTEACPLLHEEGSKFALPEFEFSINE